MTSLERLDHFYDPTVASNPYPYWEQARAQSPVWREPHHGVVLITGYEEALAIYQDNARWSSCNTAAGLQPFPVPLEGDDVGELIEQHRDQLVFSDEIGAQDPPKHTMYRSLLSRLFTPRRLSENESFMWMLADQQIDEILERRECEFVYDFANPFTALIISDLLGVPEDERSGFRDDVAKKREAYSTSGGVEVMVSDPFALLRSRFVRLIEDRRREPRDDVLSSIANGTFPDGRHPEVHEVVSLAANLFGAGQETTVHLLSASLRRIAENESLQRRLREDKAVISNFVEEVLRVDTPLKAVFRLSRVPTTIGGVDLPAGTTAMLVLGAANRDPRVFERPNEFWPDRPNVRQQISFGRGIHSCIGASLARAETRIAIERLLDRTTDIHISEAHHAPDGARGFDYRSSYMIRGLVRLHLEYAAAGR
jgi:cytochrome P450 family 150 subfamily A5